MKNFPILLNSARQLWEKYLRRLSPGKVLGIGIRCFCFLSGQFPALTGEHRRRPESALRIMAFVLGLSCLLYTSDAADEEDSGDLGGLRIIKKKKKTHHSEWRLRV